MCIGGTPSYAAPQQQTPEFQDAPPIVTGSQIGVENPKDTKKATEELKIKRKKREGTYVDPNLQRTEELLTGKRSGGRNLTRQQQKNRDAARDRAKKSALQRRMKRTAPKGQGAGAMRSDIRLKENIIQVGESKLGYKIYEFNYINENTRYRGAMAQDVMTKLPEAVGVQDGFLTVNYDMLDISMEVI